MFVHRLANIEVPSTNACAIFVYTNHSLYARLFVSPKKLYNLHEKSWNLFAINWFDKHDWCSKSFSRQYIKCVWLNLILKQHNPLIPIAFVHKVNVYIYSFKCVSKTLLSHAIWDYWHEMVFAHFYVHLFANTHTHE